MSDATTRIFNADQLEKRVCTGLRSLKKFRSKVPAQLVVVNEHIDNQTDKAHFTPHAEKAELKRGDVEVASEDHRRVNRAPANKEDQKCADRMLE